MNYNVLTFLVITIGVISIGFLIYNGITFTHNINVETKYRHFDMIDRMDCDKLEREKQIEYEKIGNTDIRRYILDKMIEKECKI